MESKALLSWNRYLTKGTQFRGHCQSASPKLVTKPHHLEAPVRTSFLYSPALSHEGHMATVCSKGGGQNRIQGREAPWEPPYSGEVLRLGSQQHLPGSFDHKPEDHGSRIFKLALYHGLPESSSEQPAWITSCGAHMGEQRTQWSSLMSVNLI